MKTMLLGVIVFALSAAVSTYVAIRRAESLPAPAAVASTDTPEAAPPPPPAPPSDPALAALDGMQPQEAGIDDEADDSPAPDSSGPSFKQVARIMGNMKASDAAEVLSHLTDAEVEGILRAVGVRKAAELMTQLPESRAAALSRRLLVSTTIAEATP